MGILDPSEFFDPAEMELVGDEALIELVEILISN